MHFYRGKKSFPLIIINKRHKLFNTAKVIICANNCCAFAIIYFIRTQNTLCTTIRYHNQFAHFRYIWALREYVGAYFIQKSSTVVYLISIISVVDISCFFFLLSASFVRLFSSSHQHILLEIIGSPTQFHSFDNVEQKSQMLHQTFFSRLMYR